MFCLSFSLPRDQMTQDRLPGDRADSSFARLAAEKPITQTIYIQLQLQQLVLSLPSCSQHTLEFGGALNSWVGDQRETAGPAWLGGATQDSGQTFFEQGNNNGAIVTNVRVTGGTADPHHQHRPPSKADVRREDLLSATSRVTR